MNNEKLVWNVERRKLSDLRKWENNPRKISSSNYEKLKKTSRTTLQRVKTIEEFNFIWSLKNEKNNDEFILAVDNRFPHLIRGRNK